MKIPGRCSICVNLSSNPDGGKVIQTGKAEKETLKETLLPWIWERASHSGWLCQHPGEAYWACRVSHPGFGKKQFPHASSSSSSSQTHEGCLPQGEHCGSNGPGWQTQAGNKVKRTPPASTQAGQAVHVGDCPTQAEELWGQSGTRAGRGACCPQTLNKCLHFISFISSSSWQPGRWHHLLSPSTGAAEAPQGNGNRRGWHRNQSDPCPAHHCIFSLIHCCLWKDSPSPQNSSLSPHPRIIFFPQ